MNPEGTGTTLREGLALQTCRCPFIRPAAAEWLWPVEGICQGRSDGRLMVPPVSHYLNLCVTDDHHLCEVFRARALVLHVVSQEEADLAAPGRPRHDVTSPPPHTPGPF